MQGKWIAAFQEWLLKNQDRLSSDKIRVEIIGITSYNPSSIHANFYASRHEATVELWEDGQSEFHWLDWEVAERDPEAGVVVTHHDFTAVKELDNALSELINQMSPVPA